MSVEGMQLRFQPKGSMCACCAFKYNDCSGLDFCAMLPIMKVIKDEDGTTMIVKCSEFKRLQ